MGGRALDFGRAHFTVGHGSGWGNSALPMGFSDFTGLQAEPLSALWRYSRHDTFSSRFSGDSAKQAGLLIKHWAFSGCLGTQQVAGPPATGVNLGLEQGTLAHRDWMDTRRWMPACQTELDSSRQAGRLRFY